MMGGVVIRKRLFSSIVKVLRERSLVSNLTTIGGEFPEPGCSFYIGFDPTAASLHIGNLIGLIVSTHMRLAGYKPILLVGGATARIGDPSFRTNAKVRIDDEILTSNTESIKRQLASIMSNGYSRVEQFYHSSSTIIKRPSPSSSFTIVDNFDWQKDIRMLDFLDKVGSTMRLSSMLGRECVQKRSSSDLGMSFTEFTYQLLQGYDFYHLLENNDCLIQLGGSDQWGNIVSGIEMIGRIVPEKAKKVAALTFPLLTTSNGEKMGKSCGNAIWLDAKMTSPFDFYQYFIQLGDPDTIKLLPLMTFSSIEEIERLKGKHGEAPERRLLQKLLAYEVTAFVHGVGEADEAVKASSLLFEEYDNIFKDHGNLQLIVKVLKQSNRYQALKREELMEVSTLLAVLKRLLPDHHSNSILIIKKMVIIFLDGLRALAQSGGIYINGKRIKDLHVPLTAECISDPTFIRVGRHDHFLLHIT